MGHAAASQRSALTDPSYQSRACRSGDTDSGGLRLAVTHTLPLDTEDVALDVVGGKGRSLAKMKTAGFPVPNGFLLTTAAYRRFVGENHLQREIIDLAKPEIIGNSVSFESASGRIRMLLLETTVSDGIRMRSSRPTMH